MKAIAVYGMLLFTFNTELVHVQTKKCTCSLYITLGCEVVHVQTKTVHVLSIIYITLGCV